MKRFEGLVFTKMSASGNDFILINNFDGKISPEDGPLLAQKLCRRAVSVGADGLILIEPPLSAKAQFSWRFYNADGSEAEMCGNGGRCAARFAIIEGLAQSPLAFETKAGLIRAEVFDRVVNIQLTTPKDLSLDIPIEIEGKQLSVSYINTGVPHVVLFWKGPLKEAPVKEWGRILRFHPKFAPEGTNVNFVAVFGPQKITLRTYERGVEDETLACGTGATAAALISAAKGLVNPPVKVVTAGGEELIVHFTPHLSEPHKRVYLEGKALVIYRATLSSEALL